MKKYAKEKMRQETAKQGVLSSGVIVVEKIGHTSTEEAVGFPLRQRIIK